MQKLRWCLVLRRAPPITWQVAPCAATPPACNQENGIPRLPLDACLRQLELAERYREVIGSVCGGGEELLPCRIAYGSAVKFHQLHRVQSYLLIFARRAEWGVESEDADNLFILKDRGLQTLLDFRRSKGAKLQSSAVKAFVSDQNFCNSAYLEIPGELCTGRRFSADE